MAARVRLIATDIDGTLLRSDGIVSERSRAALVRARAAGLAVVLVTGRPPRGVRALRLEECANLAVCANGALVYEPTGDLLILQRPFTPSVARRFVVDLRQAAPGVVFACEAGMQFCREPGYEAVHPLDLLDAVVEDAVAFSLRPVAKLLVRHPEMPLKLLIPIAEAVAGDDAEVTRSGPETLEISAGGVTKASTMELLCRQEGVTAAEVVAIGDMVNDLSLLNWAGHAVAVANAHGEVLAVADEVTGSNDEDGVAAYVERLLDGMA